jgi:hypothetical protein
MDNRIRKICITKAGGNASANSKRASISLPLPWLIQMGLSEDNRDVSMSFDGEKIVIKNANIKKS